MRFGIPLENGLLSSHFGHCQSIALIDTDPDSRMVVRTEVVPAPPHQHGVLPRLMVEQGVKVVIAGGIGGGAKALLAQAGIVLMAGAPVEVPEKLVEAYLSGTLITGDGSCGHGHGPGCNH